MRIYIWGLTNILIYWYSIMNYYICIKSVYIYKVLEYMDIEYRI